MAAPGTEDGRAAALIRMDLTRAAGAIEWTTPHATPTGKSLAALGNDVSGNAIKAQLIFIGLVPPQSVFAFIFRPLVQ